MRRFDHGYTLPSVMILSVVMFALLTVSLQLVGASSTALRDQYYEQLAREASEAGIAHAEACVKQYGAIGWSDANPLKPSTNCNGITISGLDDFVSKQGHFQATYSIGKPSGKPGNHKYTVNGATNLTSSSGSVYKSLSGNVSYDSRNAATPKITGGAGWGQGPGHINIYKSINGDIYGFGENGSGQINNPKSPSAVTKPEKMILPSGAIPVSKVQTSGQGASFLCIIGDDQQAYCRGSGAWLSNQWTKVGFNIADPSGMKVYDMALNGYGDDVICVIAGKTITDRQVYCGGTNDFGMFGDGIANPIVGGEEIPREVPISSMVKFNLPAGKTAKSVDAKSTNVCVITNDDNFLYCSGNSDNGQIAKTWQENNYTPVQYQIPKRGSVDRKVRDVFLSPHSWSSTIMVLATDGTMWAAGNKEWGSFGTSEESGVTGSNDAKLWGSSNTNWDGDNATGGSIKASSGKCLDNNNNWLNNGNKVQIWSCDTSTSAQKWFLLDNQDHTFTIWLPGKRGVPTNYCLDLNSGIAENNRPVTLYSCNGSPAQQWILDSTNNSIRSKVNSNYCLDIPGGSSTNGVAIQLYSCNNSDAQKFTIDSRAIPWRNGIALNYTFCGLRDDEYGGVWCAGKNYSTDLEETPWSDVDYNYCIASANPKTLRNDVGGMPPGTKIDLSRFSDEWKYQIDSLMFIATDGQVYGAGRNVHGKLGNDGLGNPTYKYMQCAFRRYILPAGVNAEDISARDEFSAFVLGDNGRIYASGLNTVGQLGNDSTTNAIKPVESKIPPGMGYSY